MANKDIPVNSKVTLLQKTILILFGIVLSLFLLELGLRLGGFTLCSFQEYRNLLSIRKQSEYRIMCIGESTTAGRYPRFLEKALDGHGIGIKFSVIDKGIASIDTSFILDQLENNIGRYHPDLVIAMIGTNDGASHMPVGFGSDSKSLFKSLKIYKLAKLLILHIENKIGTIQASGEKNKASVVCSKREQPNAVPVAYKQNIPNTVISEGVRKTEIKDDNFFYDLGKRLITQEDFVSAGQAFKKAISLNPYNVDAYFKLGFVSDQNTRRSLMKEIFEKYKMLLESGALDERQSVNIGHLCRVLVGKGMYSEVEEFCNEMLAQNLLRIEAYILLAGSYLEQHQYTAAESFFKKAIELNPDDNRAFDGLAVVYHETGQHDLSEQYLRKANELRPSYPAMVTIRNYKKIKGILDAKKIRLVCMQYPMRSIEPLRSIFEGEKNIIFVDNEQIFKSAVAKGLYKDFFRDMFAGDFGHCTDKGNRLLAENIANVISREVFHK